LTFFLKINEDIFLNLDINQELKPFLWKSRNFSHFEKGLGKSSSTILNRNIRTAAFIPSEKTVEKNSLREINWFQYIEALEKIKLFQTA